MLLSVIIPVYNVEDTLEQCVESVLSQIIDDMEIILVDDGSTDRSRSICDKYANNKNITVIHQLNAGLSEARNTGIEISNGDIITFVDSDDFIGNDTYPHLLKIMLAHPEYDILEYSMAKEDGKKELFHLTLPDKVYTDMAEYWIDGKAYRHSYAWNKFYRRQVFDGTRYPKGKKFEDVYALPLLLKQAKVVRTTSRGLYHYIYNSNGITVNADGNKDLLDLLKAHLPFINNPELRRHKGFEDYYYHVLNIQISTYTAIGKDSCILLPTLPYYQTWKLKLLHIIGMKNLCRLFRTAKKLHII